MIGKARNLFGRILSGIRRFFRGPAVETRKRSFTLPDNFKIGQGVLPARKARKYRKSYGFRHGTGGGADRRKRGGRCNARAKAKRRQGWR